jgi:V-type H+-transporting ATPase subunit C
MPRAPAKYNFALIHLQSELLKLSRINFSEAYQILAHLKTVRLFVESVLRYGLPADYAGIIVRPEPKTAEKTLRSLSSRFNYLAAASRGPGTRKGKTGATTSGGDDVGGEWASVMEAEYYDFVLFEIPKVEF